MSDSRRNKKYSKIKENKVILAKRDAGPKNEKNTSKSSEDQPIIQPKILLKVKDKEPLIQPQITIATRETSEPSSEATTQQSNVSIQSKEKEPPTQITIEQLAIAVPQMTRYSSLISSSTHQINGNTMKLLMKTNTDFFVVGVIGAQGVGKSTIMNLLASDELNVNIYDYFFKEKDGIFPVKCKQGKSSSFPRTDSIQMFITKDRTILLDCPPVLCNSYRKDATTNELDDIRALILLLSVCHLVIIVQDDYFNLSLIRLIQFAELTHPNQEAKSFVSDYMPNILFVKNKAKRCDFLREEKQKTEEMLKHIFKDSKLKIFVGQSDRQKRTKQQLEPEKIVNYFVFPEIKGNFAPYHPSLEILVADLRHRVFTSPRNQIYSGNTELSEGIWFELVTTIVQQKNHFFLTSYEDIRRNHTHSGNDQGNKYSNVDVID